MVIRHIWRKPAADDGWKTAAANWRQRALAAEQIARREVANRRRIGEMYADLHDEYETALGPLTTAPGSRPFDPERARETAARFAGGRRKAINHTTTEGEPS